MSILKANRIENLTTTAGGINVDNSGRIGIGTNTPSDANSNADDLVIQATGSGAGITIFSDTNNFGNIYFGDSSSAAHRGRVRYDHTNDALTLSTSASERCRILSGGGLTFNGDTAQANALDDYEEGDWTPSITFNGNNSGMSFSSRDGFYIKIGRQITCWVQCTLSSKGSSTGTARLTGLPYDVGSELSNTSIEGGGLMVYAANIQGTIRPPYAFAPESGQNHCEIYGSPDSNEQSTNLTSTYFENNTLFRGYFTYFSA